MTRKLSCPSGILPSLAYPEKPVKTRVPLKQFTGNLLGDTHCVRRRQRGGKSNHTKPTNSQQKLIPFRINSYHYSNTVEPSAILKDGGSPILAIAVWHVTQQKIEYAVRRTPLKSHFCLLFGAQQKVRRLPGRNPAVLILNLVDEL
ncbi:MAG: hypothetical protein RBR22_07435 [Desulfuromonas sp.]|nr:hypothetical protein [Desulfuromonas sp.]